MTKLTSGPSFPDSKAIAIYPLFIFISIYKLYKVRRFTVVFPYMYTVYFDHTCHLYFLFLNEKQLGPSFHGVSKKGYRISLGKLSKARWYFLCRNALQNTSMLSGRAYLAWTVGGRGHFLRGLTEFQDLRDRGTDKAEIPRKDGSYSGLLF
jgi:hypothetical protein